MNKIYTSFYQICVGIIVTFICVASTQQKEELVNSCCIKKSDKVAFSHSFKGISNQAEKKSGEQCCLPISLPLTTSFTLNYSTYNTNVLSNTLYFRCVFFREYFLESYSKSIVKHQEKTSRLKNNFLLIWLCRLII
ncbi:hypothetical protein HNR74_004831 [Flammeovirga kamogawensis]|nr:hypothetical protein [Flammeovirga kamogawensis]